MQVFESLVKIIHIEIVCASTQSTEVVDILKTLDISLYPGEEFVEIPIERKSYCVNVSTAISCLMQLCRAHCQSCELLMSFLVVDIQ